MINLGFIYKITNDINSKVYIGKTNLSIQKRFKQHCSDSKKKNNKNRPLYSAMNKYGVEHFSVELVEETDDTENREIYWISYFDSYFHGYNATYGGDGQQKYNSSEIIKELLINPYPCDVSDKFNCSRYLVRDLAEANGIKVKNKSKEALSNKKTGVSAYDKQFTLIKSFESTVEAATWCYDNGYSKSLCGGARSHIADVAKGIRKTAYGFYWKYTDNSLAA